MAAALALCLASPRAWACPSCGVDSGAEFARLALTAGGLLAVLGLAVAVLWPELKR